MKNKRGKKAQIWIETVIYTLIGLSIIAIVLGIVTPKIRELNDKTLIEDTITALNDLDSQISSTLVAAGNTRTIDLRIKKGEFIINGEEDKISFVLRDTGLEYSQPGASIPQGSALTILTEGEEGNYDVNLILNYKDKLNITFNSEDTEKTLTQAPTAYRIKIINNGKISGDLNNLDVGII